MFRLSISYILQPLWRNQQLFALKTLKDRNREPPGLCCFCHSWDITVRTLETIYFSFSVTHTLVFLSLWDPSSSQPISRHSPLLLTQTKTMFTLELFFSWFLSHFCSRFAQKQCFQSIKMALLRKISSVECFGKAPSLLFCVNEGGTWVRRFISVLNTHRQLVAKHGNCSAFTVLCVLRQWCSYTKYLFWTNEKEKQYNFLESILINRM